MLNITAFSAMVFSMEQPRCLEWNRRQVSHVQASQDPPKAPWTRRAKCEVGSANGIRTRVTAVRGRCPRPLDDSAGEPWL
jgi:hypothetical protein